jgi:glucokinase
MRQAWYRCKEWLQRERSAAEINRFYSATLPQWRVPTDASRGGPAVLASLKDVVRTALSEASVDGIGVSAAGQVDWARGAIAYASPNIPGWAGTEVKAELEALFGLPVTVDNDGNAAAYGEHWVGAAKDVSTTVMLTVGTGIGGGIVLGDHVLRGGRFRGGEVGHMILVADGVPCNCGQRGCLEVYASGTAIARQAREEIPGFEGSAKDVFAAAEQGEATADFVLGNAARALALGIVSLSSIIDPDLFVLGGGVAHASTYLHRVRAALLDPAVHGERPFDSKRVVLARLGEAAGAVGAAGQVLAR